MRIYLAGPISGVSKGAVMQYWDSAKKRFEEMGYKVFNPMTGKDQFRNDSPSELFRSAGFNNDGPKYNPIITDHAIAHRDMWMVKMVDVVYANLYNAKQVSIGTVSEIAWGKAFGKNVVVVMEPGNIHQHAFIKENATVVFETPDEAEAYLSLLVK
jgi:nucleoside 2-deoxyribosyltransferase